jgi:phosphoketolase
MDGVDIAFVDILRANPGLRVRVGNPDELRSNRMNATLDLLKHRVHRPESGVAEAVDGAVITALNEEAVVSAALANNGGINLVASYEAFAVKMLGAIRQEIIFARHQADNGAAPGWLSVPVVLTSHTWENGKNEQSHQDPTFAEAALGEMSDTSRVLFPPDWNCAMAALRAAYSTHGQVWTLIVPKRPLPVHFSDADAEKAVHVGAMRLRGNGSEREELVLIAIGAYQLVEALRASDRLRERNVGHAVVYVAEPGRLRQPRDEREEAALTPRVLRDELFPGWTEARVILTHTRPEPMAGLLRQIDTGPARTVVLGYVSRGGTLDTFGMLFANRCTWAHALVASAHVLGIDVAALLSAEELRAVGGETDPLVLDLH